MAWLYHQAKKEKDFWKKDDYGRARAFEAEGEVSEGYWKLVFRNRTISEVVRRGLLYLGLPRYTRLR